MSSDRINPSWSPTTWAEAELGQVEEPMQDRDINEDIELRRKRIRGVIDFIASEHVVHDLDSETSLQRKREIMASLGLDTAGFESYLIVSKSMLDAGVNELTDPSCAHRSVDDNWRRKVVEVKGV